jgi:Ankyrin repeats (3 copies)
MACDLALRLISAVFSTSQSRNPLMAGHADRFRETLQLECMAAFAGIRTWKVVSCPKQASTADWKPCSPQRLSEIPLRFKRRVLASPEVPRRSIHVAAALGDAEAALQLLADAPSRAIERGGLRQWTPLYYCCSTRHGRGDASIAGARARVAERLLALGADPNDEIATHDEPGGFRSVLQGAAREVASAELVGVLLAARASLLPTNGTAGPPIPLTDAVSGGNLACLERLLAARPDAWQAREALEVAIFHDRRDMARRLVDYGAQPTVAGRWWGHHGSCLHAAILLRRTKELLEVLLASDVDISKRDRDGRTAYAVAVRTGHDVAAGLLRARGASEGELSDVDHIVAACMRLGTQDVRRLLTADPNLKARYRETDHLMLGWAIRNGRPAAVPLLVEAGLDPSVVDSEGDTPLHLAVAAGHEDGVTALLVAGASRTARNYRGRTPFGEPIATEEQRERDERFERAADAVAFGALETLRELLDGEPDLVHWRSPRPHRATLLLYCGANGTEGPRQRTPPNAPAIAQLLLDRGADPNAAGNFYGGGKGATTLALISDERLSHRGGLDADLVRVIVRAGARLDLWPDGGPMLWAIERGPVSERAGAGRGRRTCRQPVVRRRAQPPGSAGGAPLAWNRRQHPALAWQHRPSCRCPHGPQGSCCVSTRARRRPDGAGHPLEWKCRGKSTLFQTHGGRGNHRKAVTVHDARSQAPLWRATVDEDGHYSFAVAL